MPAATLHARDGATGCREVKKTHVRQRAEWRAQRLVDLELCYESLYVFRRSKECSRVKWSETMASAKQQVKSILEDLPEDASFEDIQYHIYVRQKIEQGLADAEAGRVIPHEEVVRRLAKWLEK